MKVKTTAIENSKEWMNRNLTLCAFSAMMVPKIVFDEINLTWKQVKGNIRLYCDECSKKTKKSK